MIRLLLAFLAAAFVTALVFSQSTVRTDMADLLPGGTTASTRFILREIRQGDAATLILAGIEGAPQPELARLSRTVTGALRKSGQFSLVLDSGAGLMDEADALFAHRYLLAPADPQAFTADGLHKALERLLAGLASSAEPLLARYGFADPTGAFFRVLQAWMPGNGGPQTQDGVWFARDRPRALLLLRTRASGVDLAGQTAAQTALANAFRDARPGSARLLTAGPAVFTVEAARTIRSDVERLTFISGALILALLIWRFRSPFVIAALALPPLLGIAAAALAVQAADGMIHGITLGFGLTMLGVTLDYPVLWIGHRRPGEPPAGTRHRIGRALGLTVFAAALGLAGMAFSGFPALAQLGLFAVTGIVTAAAATFLLLPPLVAGADIAPPSQGAPPWLLKLERVRRWRALGLIPVACAVGALAWHGMPPVERDLSKLTPVPQARLALNDQLRAEMGQADAGALLVVQGDSREQVLEREEDLQPTLTALIQRHALVAAPSAADLLPSIRIQRARQAALPDHATLAANLAEAQKGFDFTPDAFAPFLADVAAAKHVAPVTGFGQKLLSARIAPILFQNAGSWYGLITPEGLKDPGALAHLPHAELLDLGTATSSLVNTYTRQAWHWLAAGAALVIVALTLFLRDVRRLAAVLAPIAGAVLITLAVLALTHTRLSLFHITALQLMVGISLDYALFFARRGPGNAALDDEERARTFRTLITCNAMTLLTFGLLATCRTPLLSSIGVTVAVGTASALLLGFLLGGGQRA